MDDGQMELLARAVEISSSKRIAELSIDFTLDHINSYEALVPYQIATIHDADTVAAAGMSQPIASGSMLVAYTVERLLPGIFSEGWSRAGSLALSFTRPVVPGDRVVLAADVVAKLPRRENTLVVMKLSATLPNGDIVAVGSASAIAAGSS
jgi:acyl dehydratase